MRRRVAGVRLLAAMLAGALAGCDARTPIAELPTTTVRVADHLLELAVADSEAERRQGLAGVGSLAGLDGMLFVFDAPATPTLTSSGVEIPLEIVWVDPNRHVIATTPMPPCGRGACPTFDAPGPVRWIIEAAAGSVDAVGAGHRVEIDLP